MAQGIFKNGEAIEVTYQATAAQTGLNDVKMEVYDASHALDANKGVAAMTEIASTGRYYGTFTPDAEGNWTVEIDSVTKPGKIVKKYSIVGHNVDSIGDAVAGQNDLSTSDVATELATYDAPTKAELDSAVAVTDGKVDVVDGKVDALNDISTNDIDTALATYDGPTKAEMDSKIEGINLESGPMVG